MISVYVTMFVVILLVTGFKPRHFDNLLKRVSPTIQSIDLSMMHTCLGNDAVKTIGMYTYYYVKDATKSSYLSAKKYVDIMFYLK